MSDTPAKADDWLHLKQYGFAPGDYMSKCHTCGFVVCGLDKRASCCRPCAERRDEAARASHAMTTDTTKAAALAASIEAGLSSGEFLSGHDAIAEAATTLRALAARVDAMEGAVAAEPCGPRYGWLAGRPDCGGTWLWKEGGRGEPVALKLTADGSEVDQPADDDSEGTPQYYWEQTPTDARHMPGLWKRLSPAAPPHPAEQEQT